jgi:hypothetical protein
MCICKALHIKKCKHMHFNSFNYLIFMENISAQMSLTIFKVLLSLFSEFGLISYLLFSHTHLIHSAFLSVVLALKWNEKI